MPAPLHLPVRPVRDEHGLASWDPADLAAVALPAWDAFLEIAAAADLDAPSRLPGLTARDVCVHLGSWTGSRSLRKMREEAERGDVDLEDPRSGTFDKQSHDEAVLEAWAAAPRAQVLAALREARQEVADYLGSDEPKLIGHRSVRSALGPLPLSTLVTGIGFELAVHALDLAPAGARSMAPPPELIGAGLAALVDTTGALAARDGLTAAAACATPVTGWGFTAVPGAWTTLELPELPETWPRVEGTGEDLLDAAAGRRPAPAMLARRDLRLHHVAGLLALAPLVESVPGLPGGPALQAAVRNARALTRLVRRLPGIPR